MNRRRRTRASANDEEQEEARKKNRTAMHELRPRRRPSLLGGLEHRLELLLALHVHLLQQVRLFLVLLLLLLAALGLLLLDHVYLGLQVLDLLLQLLVGLHQVLRLLAVLVPALLCLERLAHAEGDGGLVEALVGTDGPPDLVADAQQEQTALGADDGDLPDELVEALRVELLPDGAYARLASLSLLQPLVQVLLQIDHVRPGGRGARHVLHPQLVLLRPLAGRQDGVQDVLGLRHGRLRFLGPPVLVLLALGASCGIDEVGGVVLHEGGLHLWDGATGCRWAASWWAAGRRLGGSRLRVQNVLRRGRA